MVGCSGKETSSRPHQKPEERVSLTRALGPGEQILTLGRRDNHQGLGRNGMAGEDSGHDSQVEYKGGEDGDFTCLKGILRWIECIHSFMH